MGEQKHLGLDSLVQRVWDGMVAQGQALNFMCPTAPV